MKKYITAAALLVAGTALSNAAVLDTDGIVAHWSFDNGSTTYTSYTGATSGVTTGIIEAHQNASGGWNDSGYISSFSEDSTTKIDFYSNLSGFGISANSFTISFKVKGLTADYMSMVSFAVGNVQFDLQTSNSNNGNQICLYGGNSIIFANDTKSIVRGDEWANVVIVGDNGTLTLYVNDLSGATTYTADEGTLLSNFQLASKWGDGTRAANADFDELVLWNKALSDDYVAQLTSGAAIPSSAIPEPSAFGLLAGAGALALVAARRRRAK